MNRRQLLRLLTAAVAGLPLRVRADAWQRSRVGVCHLDLGAELVRPRALSDLMTEVSRVSSVPVRVDVPTLEPTDPGLFDEPFLALLGSGGFPMPTDAGLDALRRHLGSGGTLLVDDSSALEDSAFHDDVRRLLDRLFPEAPLTVLDSGHAVYRSFFLIDRVVGRYAVRPYLEGIAVGDVTPVIVSRNDLAGAWSRAADGSWAWEVIPGGTAQRTHALELGVNIVMYAVTANYKLDAVHVEALLKRLREEGRIP